jgi:hypothetical protein
MDRSRAAPLPAGALPSAGPLTFLFTDMEGSGTRR